MNEYLWHYSLAKSFLKTIFIQIPWFNGFTKDFQKQSEIYSVLDIRIELTKILQKKIIQWCLRIKHIFPLCITDYDNQL